MNGKRIDCPDAQNRFGTSMRLNELGSGGIACFDFGTAFAKVAFSDFTTGGRAAAVPVAIGRVAGDASDFMVPSEIFVSDDMVFIGTPARQRLHREAFNDRDALTSFKTLLHAPDLELLLNTLVTPRVDPSRTLTYRTLIVLFLAYLVSLSRAASRLPGSDERPFPEMIRYVFPDWIPTMTDRRLKMIGDLFNAAFEVDREFGIALSEGRVPLTLAQSVVMDANVSRKYRRVAAGAVFEPAAAVAAFLAYNRDIDVDSVVAIDLGAGTTDFAGFVRIKGKEEFRLLPETRHSIDTAGDVFDHGLLNMIVDDRRLGFSKAQKTTAWRRLHRFVRDLKFELFSKGNIRFTFGTREVAFSLSDYLDWPEVKAACAEIGCNLRNAVKLTRQGARSRKTAMTGIVVAGGGASFPFIDSILSEALLPEFKNGWRRIGVPDTAASPIPDRAAFGQLSTSLGGACVGPELVSIFEERHP